MGSDYEVDGTRMGEHVVASPRTKALQVEEILVGLRNTLTEGIERLRWLIDYGYNSCACREGEFIYYIIYINPPGRYSALLSKSASLTN